MYHDVLTEMVGEDKDEALRYINDDFQFDSWLKRYAAKMKNRARKTGQGTHHVTHDTYMKRTKGMLPNPGNDG